MIGNTQLEFIVNKIAELGLKWHYEKPSSFMTRPHRPIRCESGLCPLAALAVNLGIVVEFEWIDSDLNERAANDGFGLMSDGFYLNYLIQAADYEDAVFRNALVTLLKPT